MADLDDIDLKILSALQAQGDLTNLKLAKAVGLSASSCLQRVRRLRQAGYIRGFASIVDSSKFASSIIVYANITLSEQNVRRFTIFERAVQKIPEILECSLVGGDFNYFLKIMSRDLQHFNELVQLMMEMDIGIKIFTMFVEIRNVKRAPFVPLSCFRTGAS
jgi:DNA-binding Lrp family transcriptional regulator